MLVEPSIFTTEPVLSLACARRHESEREDTNHKSEKTFDQEAITISLEYGSSASLLDSQVLPTTPAVKAAHL